MGKDYSNKCTIKLCISRWIKNQNDGNNEITEITKSLQKNRIRHQQK